MSIDVHWFLPTSGDGRNVAPPERAPDIEYLAQTDIANLIPARLMAIMNQSHFLFLGYTLGDWNLRVILHRIWGHQPFEDAFTSWAIQKSPSRLEDKLWRRRNVEILDVELEHYVTELARALRPAEV